MQGLFLDFNIFLRLRSVQIQIKFHHLRKPLWPLWLPQQYIQVIPFFGFLAFVWLNSFLGRYSLYLIADILEWLTCHKISINMEVVWTLNLTKNTSGLSTLYFCLLDIQCSMISSKLGFTLSRRWNQMGWGCCVI